MTGAERKHINSIMVWGGMHGHLPDGDGGCGVPLVNSLQPNKSPIPGVDAAIANPRAVMEGKRFIERNLAFCIGNPLEEGNTYENRLIQEILQRSSPKDLIVDIHQQPMSSAQGIDVICLGPQVFPYVLGFAEEVGITTLFVSEGTGLQSQSSKVALLDFYPGSSKDTVGYLRSKLEATINYGLPTPPLEEFTIYLHTDINEKQRKRLGKGIYSQLEYIPGASKHLGVEEREIYSYADNGTISEIVTPLSHKELALVRLNEYRQLVFPTFSSLLQKE